ncbi:hypothetical protein [Polynucleobacter sp. AP-Sving-400A-A2]|uniref:hypothetical protein n=1 Tax=Polynucleobacter sp. AP-Sving-400A-A2 TaxID=2081049 RepID=UPI001BFDB7F9|nr:hypothetical protein [Polynucleobacter sp. AP-Sving-400A-A2]QWE14861.1 hypothetical protein C2758_01585 [Polynucleobacter sp. AP-Sving-400A-A2]
MSDQDSEHRFAPIVIHTYIRIDHLKNTIESLLQNDLAGLTDLFIASDAPRSDVDKPDVCLLREYIKSISGFKSVTAIFREENLGAYDNSRLLVDEVFKKAESLISIEDDTIVGRGFLRYINDGLALYKGDESVFAICGYLDKSVSINSSTDAVLLPGFAAWGYGIWKDRFYEVPKFEDLAAEFLWNPKLFLRMNLNRPDLLQGARAVSNGLVAADFAFLLHMIKTKKRCLFPSYSLVRNMGNDGTGENCMFDLTYESQPYNKEKMIHVGLDKTRHYYPNNPFFSSLGGWNALIINLIKFIAMVIFGERFFKNASSLKGSIKQMKFK